MIMINKEVTIDFFKKYYKNSIQINPNNHYGENGQGVNIPESEKEEKEKRYSLHKFNELASSRIPFLRKIPEKRRPSCFNRTFSLNLPSSSIIIIYHNEAFSTLLRTVHTAISRSPSHLINEIILVDDNSNYERFPHLLKQLDDHFKNLPKVKIIRSKIRIGLINARLLGAKAATSEVLIFLDSHCECFDGWIEPLLDSIKKNPYASITPVIDVISMADFSIDSDVHSIIGAGTFSWNSEFDWFLPKQQDDSARLVKSPTMAGGLFAIRKKFFFDIGSYDEQMTYWGGENIEISFRLWMCAKGIYIDPCSIVGHVFRNASPHDMESDSIFYNKLRAVEVWMDDYKKIVYSRIGIQNYDERAGSLEKRIKLRNDLKCKNFEWYLKNVATELRVPGKYTIIRNPYSDKCVDAGNNHESGKNIKVYECHQLGGNQAIEVDSSGIIIFDKMCLDLAEGYIGALPTFYNCHFEGGNQKWNYLDDYLIQHSVYNLCLKIDKQTLFLSTAKCDKNDQHQIFEFNFSK